MRALVAAPDNPDGIELREVDEPQPAPHEAVVEVRAISLNRGEMNRLFAAEDGWRPGWDVAGVVVRQAGDGSGPAEGTRVAGFTPERGWAERAAVATTHLGRLPGRVDFAAASTLPVAGLTALRALRQHSLLLGTRVLITGAAGGVGRFAVQLAARAGSHVTAIVGSPERGEGVRDLGADEVIIGIDAAQGAFDLILESAGGSSLATALRLIAPHGTIVSFGNSSRDLTTFNVSDFYPRSGARLVGFRLPAPDAEPFTRDLEYLAALLAENGLDPQIALQASWRESGRALTALRDRRLAGKAVLLVD